MSSSDPNSKIDFLDAPEVVRRKIKGAFCEEGNVEENGVLAFVEAVLMPISELRLDRMRGETAGADREEGADADADADVDQTPFASEDAPPGTLFSIPRKAEHGGPLHYASFDALRADFAARRVHPKDLKTAVGDAIVRLLAPIRRAFEESEEWRAVERLAYPDPNAKPEKKKKVRVSCRRVLFWPRCVVLLAMVLVLVLVTVADVCACSFVRAAEDVPPAPAW